MPEQHRHLSNKYEDIVNLQEAEAYSGGRPPAYSLFNCVFILSLALDNIFRIPVAQCSLSLNTNKPNQTYGSHRGAWSVCVCVCSMSRLTIHRCRWECTSRTRRRSNAAFNVASGCDIASHRIRRSCMSKFTDCRSRRGTHFLLSTYLAFVYLA